MNDHRSDIRRIMTAVNTIDGIYALEAKKIGLKENTLSLLYALDDGKAHTQTQICAEWLIPKTTINTIVKECIHAGYVTLEAGGHSHEKRIKLTEQGQAYAKNVLAQVYAIEEKAMEKTTGQFSLEFIDAVQQFSCHLRREFDNYFKEEPHESIL